jgi:hypothetical protein
MLNGLPGGGINSRGKGLILVAISVTVAAALLAVAIIWVGLRLRGVLLGWYIREVKRIEIAEAPGEAIVTYPLA